MSGFGDYARKLAELAELDHEIRHYATVCGISLANRYEIDACLNARHEALTNDRARENLHGLLILRIKVETEMLELGFTPPPLIPPQPINPD